MAKLYFRYGAMNCGKTTALIQVAHNYEERGMNVIIVKPTIDTKGDNKIISRIGKSRRVDILADKKLDLAKKIREIKNVNCILVDEAQFLTSKQVDQLFDLTIEDNIPVIAYGIRGDFQTKAFPGSLRLFEVAHAIEEIKTICRCGKKAIFNGRKENGEFVFEGNQVAIDGKHQVEYESLCGSCYKKHKQKVN